MSTVLFDNLHPLAEEHFDKHGYPSSKNTRVAIERELEEDQRLIDFIYEEYLANLKEDNQNDK